MDLVLRLGRLPSDQILRGIPPARGAPALADHFPRRRRAHFDRKRHETLIEHGVPDILSGECDPLL
jgi:hypothetical protein